MDLAKEIKDRVGISDVLALYRLELGRAGFLRCPFHPGDRDASLKIYPSQDSWHCFGCGRGGSVIDFVMEMDRCDFWQAVKKLDGEFGLGLTGVRPTLRDALQRQQERDQRVFAQTVARDRLRQKVLQRRALWLKCREMQVATHQQAQEMARMLAEIQRLDAEIDEERGRGIAFI